MLTKSTKSTLATFIQFDHSHACHKRTALMEGRGSLEEQLEAVKRKAGEITAKKESLKAVEERGAHVEEALIFDNKYVAN